ncbi:LysR family transcriptional regulator [Caballeronia choica]|jgi:LysR family transcriptional regulator, glycine cleavage system transcriptional activator|uniref:LysR family transcriptional regulator n=1 Tax=Caballeronia choica TaxID=326476 RepID=A0A158KBD0_9BURK|nr:LysR substrate-binding domain-containing protein [Caballeronia choica]SAL78442.1 LysR family transcriptional regulator [Caballeronia choica]
MLKRYPSIQSMQAFLQAARAGSFSSAARQLSLTHSAISQQVRTLEEFVGQPLFMREGARVVLTDAGALFANQLADGFEQIDRALSSVKERAVKQSITLDVDPELAQSWLVARLPALLGGLAGTSLTVLSAPRHDRSAFERADLALRYGYGEWDGFENALICGDRLTVVSSPGLLKARGLDARCTPEQVLELPLLGYTKRSWIPWLAAAGLPAVEPDAVAVFDNAAGLIAAASAGVGVGLARGLLAADARREGRLVEITQVEIPTHYNLYAVWPREKAARVAPLVEAIRGLVAQTINGNPRT